MWFRFVVSYMTLSKLSLGWHGKDLLMIILCFIRSTSFSFIMWLMSTIFCYNAMLVYGWLPSITEVDVVANHFRLSYQPFLPLFLLLLLLRRQFQEALSEQLLYLTQLLSPSLLLLFNGSLTSNKRQLLSLFDLIYSVLNPGPGDSPSSSCLVRLSSQSLCRVLQALLSHHFSLMKMAAIAILKSKTLLVIEQYYC